MCERSFHGLKELDRRGALETRNAKWTEPLTRRIANAMPRSVEEQRYGA
jgi:hypothetical protein